MTNRRSPDNELRFVIFHWSFAKSLSSYLRLSGEAFWLRLVCTVFICGFVPKAWELKNEQGAKR